MVIQSGMPDADHVQDDVVETENELAVPVAGAETVEGVTVKLQVPLCVTEYVRPAMVTLPVRCVVAVFAATLTLTLPLPVPLAPAVTVSHAAELVAVHAQPLDVVTATLLVSPGDSTVRLVGLMA